MKIYAAVNSKGGAGKSSILVAFASTMHHQGKRVCILDLDSPGALPERLNLNNRREPLPADEILIEAGQFAKERVSYGPGPYLKSIADLKQAHADVNSACSELPSQKRAFVQLSRKPAFVAVSQIERCEAKGQPLSIWDIP